MCFGRPATSAAMPASASSVRSLRLRLLDEALAAGALFVEQARDALVGFRLQVAEGQVLELPLRAARCRAGSPAARGCRRSARPARAAPARASSPRRACAPVAWTAAPAPRAGRGSAPAAGGAAPRRRCGSRVARAGSTPARRPAGRRATGARRRRRPAPAPRPRAAADAGAAAPPPALRYRRATARAAPASAAPRAAAARGSPASPPAAGAARSPSRAGRASLRRPRSGWKRSRHRQEEIHHQLSVRAARAQPRAQASCSSCRARRLCETGRRVPRSWAKVCTRSSSRSCRKACQAGGSGVAAAMATPRASA